MLLWQAAASLTVCTCSGSLQGPFPLPGSVPPRHASSCSSSWGQSCVSSVLAWVTETCLCFPVLCCSLHLSEPNTGEPADCLTLSAQWNTHSAQKLLSHTSDHLFFILMMIRISPEKLSKNVTAWALSSFQAPRGHTCFSGWSWSPPRWEDRLRLFTQARVSVNVQPSQILTWAAGLRPTALTSASRSNEGWGFMLLPFPRQHGALWVFKNVMEGKSIPMLTPAVQWRGCLHWMPSSRCVT